MRTVRRRASPAADRYTLIRRVYLDLTGIPPTPEQADAFVADRRPDAVDPHLDGLGLRVLRPGKPRERLALGQRLLVVAKVLLVQQAQVAVRRADMQMAKQRFSFGRAANGASISY